MKSISIAQIIVIKRILKQVDLSFDTVMAMLGYSVGGVKDLTMEQAAAVLAYCFTVHIIRKEVNDVVL